MFSINEMVKQTFSTHQLTIVGKHQAFYSDSLAQE